MNDMSFDIDISIVLILGLLSLVVVIGFMISFVFVYQRRQLQNRQEKATLHAQHQQEILQVQLEIQNQTLQHISGELHDNIGQLMTLVRFKLNMLEIEETITPKQIEEVNEVVGKTIDELRGLSKSLDGDFVKNFGLVDSLKHLLQRIAFTGKYETDILIEGEAYQLDGQKEIVLFRVVQEILSNILKHAKAKYIKVSLQFTPAHFSLTVQDDGKGFDYEAVLGREMSKSGVGLRNIQRRTEMLGGTCTFKTAQNEGTSVHIQLPSL
ncbi:sensor histidine kinase [Runella sp.]|uniref:sensor histidine kinase n=1 Tax=Runella sp. TaxID=1960881 RepID=UPI0026247DF7|nr:ATP-binding protein [Runella sp.]